MPVLELYLTCNIKYNSVVTHIIIIKVREGWVTEKLKIIATTTVLIANIIWEEIHDSMNTYCFIPEKLMIDAYDEYDVYTHHS